MENAASVSEKIVLPQSDDEAFEEAWEWRRLSLAVDGGFWDLLCCPEDVVLTTNCDHRNNSSVHTRHIVCKHCLGPMCYECHEYMSSPPLYASPMALANDNVLGYIYKRIQEYKASWIEAVAAQPAAAQT